MELKFKIKFKRADMQALEQKIQALLSDFSNPDLIEAITIALLSEVLILVKKKLVEHKNEYKINFTTAQALALRNMARLYIEAPDLGNIGSFDAKLLLICGEIDKTYNYEPTQL